MEEQSIQQNTTPSFLHRRPFRWILYGVVIFSVLAVLWSVQNFNKVVSEQNEITGVVDTVPAEVTPEIIKTEIEQFEVKAKAEAVIIPADVVAAEQAEFLAKVREEVKKEKTNTIE